MTYLQGTLSLALSRLEFGLLHSGNKGELTLIKP